jgi:hypothetical protein
MLSKSEIERIEALNAARTQELVRVGPLEGTTPEKWAQTVEQFAYISKAHGDADPQFWAVAIESPEQDGDVVTAMTGNGPTSKANAEFYAACHWAVPALLRHIEDVEGERDHLRELLRPFAELDKRGEATRITVDYQNDQILIGTDTLRVARAALKSDVPPTDLRALLVEAHRVLVQGGNGVTDDLLARIERAVGGEKGEEQ